MKILIVDDNANNRMVLNLFLQDFSEKENGIHYTVEECENGLEAVEKAQSTKYELIFMDIMMPGMDGIEATQKIREFDKDVMIIAISAVDDELKKKEILRSGAEDYVSKPINVDILFARLENYFSLVSLRKSEKKFSNTKAVNLYTKNIFHRQMTFYVENDEALSEFWEYYLLGDEAQKVDNLSDVVRAIFSFGEMIVKLHERPWIIVEADEKSLYFTLDKIDTLSDMLVQLILRKNKEVADYKYEKDKISFKLEKKITPIESDLFAPLSDKTAPSQVESLILENIEIAKTDVESYRVFNYMDPEDLEEVEEHMGDLSSLILMLGSSTLEAAEVMRLATLMEKIGGRLTVYTESYAIGQSLVSLSQAILLHIDRFQEIANDLSTISAAFIADLQSWLNMTFYVGAPSIDFMNDTIIVNAQTITSMLMPAEESADEGDMDDIFDF